MLLMGSSKSNLKLLICSHKVHIFLFKPIRRNNEHLGATVCSELSVYKFYYLLMAADELIVEVF